jgi:hypothetical protein
MARLHHDRADSAVCMRCNNPVVISPVLSYTSRYTMYSCITHKKEEAEVTVIIFSPYSLWLRI